MKIKINKKQLVLTLLSLVMLPFAARSTSAQEIIITDNGSGSNNEITITNTSSTTVNQSNDAQITNSVNTQANTGENTLNNNTAENTSVQTGNISTSTTIQNNLNQSVANVGCCDNKESSANISNNGSESQNAISYTNTTTTVVTAQNTATITNNVQGTAVTGNNSASQNLGNVSITTGDIKVEEKIKNISNNSQVTLKTNVGGDFILTIKGNGEGSENTITLTENRNNIVTVNNVSDILNNSLWNLITGNNTGDYNNGNVVIKTGNIDLSVLVDNEVNKSKVEIDCCKKPGENPPPGNGGENPPPPPPPPPSNGGNGGNAGNGNNGNVGNDGGGGAGRGGEVLAAVTKEILPITGNLWFIIAILGNILMLFFGMVLRLRSGRSPSFAVSF